MGRHLTRRRIWEDHRLDQREPVTEASQFRDDWRLCVETVGWRLLQVSDSAIFPHVLRTELNTWFQPEHPRGAWLRALSNDRPEAAATLRQRLTEIQFPERHDVPAPLWLWMLALTAIAAVILICFRLTSLPAMVRTSGTLVISLLVVTAGVLVWRRELRRRRLHFLAAVMEVLEREGARLAAILEEC